MHPEVPEGATPIDPDEAAGLRMSWVATQGELNAVEQANILEAQAWLARRRGGDVLTETFVRDLHRRMLGNVWEWAGTFRQNNKNLGVDWPTIGERLRQVLDDARYWCDNGTYGPDEVGVRFHHRLVTVHCFPNGNGRHARLAADALMRQLGEPPFSWGAGGGDVSLVSPSTARQRYLEALRAADRHQIAPLLQLARS